MGRVTARRTVARNRRTDGSKNDGCFCYIPKGPIRNPSVAKSPKEQCNGSTAVVAFLNLDPHTNAQWRRDSGGAFIRATSTKSNNMMIGDHAEPSSYQVPTHSGQFRALHMCQVTNCNKQSASHGQILRGCTLFLPLRRCMRFSSALQHTSPRKNSPGKQNIHFRCSTSVTSMKRPIFLDLRATFGVSILCLRVMAGPKGTLQQ